MRWKAPKASRRWARGIEGQGGVTLGAARVRWQQLAQLWHLLAACGEFLWALLRLLGR